MGPWIRIGDFARLARTTVRTLRHYEDEGLLLPVHVRRQSGYRYYDPAQLVTWQRIVMLRELGMSVPDIRAVVTQAGDGAQQLLAYRDRVALGLAHQEKQLEQLDAFLREMTQSAQLSPPAIRVRSIPVSTAYCLRATLPSLGFPVMDLFETAERKARGARIDESPFLLYHSDCAATGEYDVEVCIPVAAKSSLTGVRQVPGADSAGSLVYQGDYAQSDHWFDRLAQWICATGSKPLGPKREVYHRFGANLSGYELPPHRLTGEAAAYVTELQLPFTR
ncbi:MAG TPA: MerR family transcriptional regulator [Steroidobacteraceae bacterium]|nr:MerR family transcriptional regulator [Steroidobacteraceae bacterium]